MFKFPNIEKLFWISSIFSCSFGVYVCVVPMVAHPVAPLQPPAWPAYARRLCAPASAKANTHNTHTPRARMHIRTDSTNLGGCCVGLWGRTRTLRGGEGNRLRKTREGFLSFSALQSVHGYFRYKNYDTRQKIHARSLSCCYQTRLSIMWLSCSSHVTA